jgi:O-antigen ligase
MLLGTVSHLFLVDLDAFTRPWRSSRRSEPPMRIIFPGYVEGRLRSITTAGRPKLTDPQALTRLSDWLAVGAAASLPWSTSASGILIALWLAAVLPTLSVDGVRRELFTPAGGLPVLLCVLAAVGMVWADVTWSERLVGLRPFYRLLFIPLLLAHFRRSENGSRVFYGYLTGAFGVLVVSWALALVPGLTWRGWAFGVPTKDYIFQSESFAICALALVGRACENGRVGQWRSVLGLVALAALFLANIFFVATGRIILLVLPVLIVFVGWRQFSWKGLLAAGLVGVVVGVTGWFASPYLRTRLNDSVAEFQAYRTSDTLNSTALHLDFLRKSLTIVAAAPVIGHGTGSMAEQFRSVTSSQTGASSVVTQNPHNQILAVAIQLGFIGAGLLTAMWIAHLLLFRGAGLNALIGAIVVIENVVSSLFNSHLFDFTQGWLYVFGVGVAGGMVLRERDRAIKSP